MMRIFPPYSFSCAIQSSFPQFLSISFKLTFYSLFLRYFLFWRLKKRKVVTLLVGVSLL